MNKNDTNRREFIRDVTQVGVLTTIGLIAPATQVLAHVDGGKETLDVIQAEHAFLTPPYLQALTPNSVDIMFITNNRAYSWVQFGENELTNKAHTVSDGFVKAYNRVNCITLNNLKPNTNFSYKIVSKEIALFNPYDLKYGVKIETDVFSFKTPALNEIEVKCIIFNDIHDRPQSFGELLKMNGENSFDFVLLNGDMFDYQDDEEQIIKDLLTPCTNLFAKNIPFLMVRGNHETRGKFRSELKNYFSYPSNDYYFTFNWGPVHWTILDSGEDKPDDAEVYAGIVDFDAFREEQAVWLEKEMQKPAYKEAAFKIVVMHIPPFYSGDWHGTRHCRKVFSPLFEKYKVDMVISGHTHKYGIHSPSKEHSYPIIIGGGPKNGYRTITNLKANSNKLEISMIDDNGKEVGNYSIKK